jgi:hypothetical protein
MDSTESAVRLSLTHRTKPDLIWNRIRECLICPISLFVGHKADSTVHKPEKKEKAAWDIAAENWKAWR